MHFQILQMQGKYQRKPPLPFVAGAEFAGRIAKNSPIPKGCPYRPGDRVFGATQGAFADKVCFFKYIRGRSTNQFMVLRRLYLGRTPYLYRMRCPTNRVQVLLLSPFPNIPFNQSSRSVCYMAY